MGVARGSDEKLAEELQLVKQERDKLVKEKILPEQVNELSSKKDALSQEVELLEEKAQALYNEKMSDIEGKILQDIEILISKEDILIDVVKALQEKVDELSKEEKIFKEELKNTQDNIYKAKNEYGIWVKSIEGWVKAKNSNVEKKYKDLEESKKNLDIYSGNLQLRESIIKNMEVIVSKKEENLASTQEEYGIDCSNRIRDLNEYIKVKESNLEAQYTKLSEISSNIEVGKNKLIEEVNKSEEQKVLLEAKSDELKRQEDQIRDERRALDEDRRVYKISLQKFVRDTRQLNERERKLVEKYGGK